MESNRTATAVTDNYAPRGFTAEQREAWSAKHLEGYIALLIEEREEEERNGAR